MKCKNCGRDKVSAFEDEQLCDSCFDFLNGHSSYNPAIPNPVLEAVQQAIWESSDDGYEDPEDYDDYWDD